MKASISKREQNCYSQNKEAKIGDTIKCPICGNVFIKKQYSQTFCCKDCKNAYWNSSKPDRHKDKNYQHNYNKAHPERLNRGFTKGVKEKRNTNIWYDIFGRSHSRDFFNPTFSDLLDYKCHVEWHDDDWCEDCD